MKSLKRCCFSLICREIILGNHMCFMLQASASAIPSSLELSSLLHLFSICYFQCICTKNNRFCSALDLRYPHTHSGTLTQWYISRSSRWMTVAIAASICFWFFLSLNIYENWFLICFFFWFFAIDERRLGRLGCVGMAFRLAERDLCQSVQWQRFSWANKVVHVALSYSYIMPIHPATYVTCCAPSPSPSLTPYANMSTSGSMSMSARSIHERARWQNTIWFESEHSKTGI